MPDPEGPLRGFRLQFTEEFEAETVLFGLAPEPFPREGDVLAGATLRLWRKTYQVIGLKLRPGPAVVAKGEMIGLIVQRLDPLQQGSAPRDGV